MKKIINEIKVRLLAKSENAGVCRGIISEFVSTLTPTVEELGDIRLSVDEAVTNCIVHAYKDNEDKNSCYIYISARLYDTREISIEISDNGCGIADIDTAFKAGYTTGEPNVRSGMGFTIINTFMDYLKIKSKLDKGTTVLMKKFLA